jgi:zinc/manganese transport system substrate-binding protein
MAKAICDKLCELDPSHESAYHANLRAFLNRLEAKLPEWRATLAPFKGQELVGYHKEWPYLMRFAGLKMEQYLEPKPGIPPTPRQSEFLERYVRERSVRVVVQASFNPPQAAQALAKRTGARVVTLCQNVRELPECGNYIATVDYNITQLAGALGGG